MSYQDKCAANPAKTECAFSCPCQGHYKAYPNQECRCGEKKEYLPLKNYSTQEYVDKFTEDGLRQLLYIGQKELDNPEVVRELEKAKEALDFKLSVC